MEKFSRRDFLKFSGVSLGGLLVPDLLMEELQVNTSDVLDFPTQTAIKLEAESLLTDDPKKANEIGNMLNEVVYSSASNICGPLAIWALKNIVTIGVEPKEFMTANVRRINSGDMYDVFYKAFPVEKFDIVEVTEPIANFDFGSINLQPGDFLYMRGANGHGDDHMMTISSRDVYGVLWATTNYPNNEGEFIIKNVPFWNKQNQGKSWIKELAAGRNAGNFSSGQGGFVLWRMKPGETSAYNLIDHSPRAIELRETLEDFKSHASANWRWMISDVNSGKILSENDCRGVRHSASTIKVSIALCAMSILESKSKDSSEVVNLLNTTRVGGFTLARLMKEMLVDSAEPSTAAVAEFIASQKVNSEALLKSWGIMRTVPSYRRSTEEDMQKVFMKIYNLADSSALRFRASHSYLLDLLSTYTSNDETRLGKLVEFGVPVTRIYNKRGSIAEANGIVVADAGIVEVINDDGGRSHTDRYFISLNGQPYKGKDCYYETMENELLRFIEIFSSFSRDRLKA